MEEVPKVRSGRLRHDPPAHSVVCTKILSKDALFFLVNSYTTGLAPAVLTYMLATELKPWNGKVESQEIGLPVKNTGLVLPCGASGRWESCN